MIISKSEMGIKDALDLAKTDASYDKRMQSKAEMEYETLKTSIKFIKTKEKKKVYIQCFWWQIYQNLIWNNKKVCNNFVFKMPIS